MCGRKNPLLVQLNCCFSVSWVGSWKFSRVQTFNSKPQLVAFCGLGLDKVQVAEFLKIIGPFRHLIMATMCRN